jgi:uncharacterized membrane protein YedE/YeeE
MHSSIINVISAVLLGLSLGYILQRGSFCLNSAFQEYSFLGIFRGTWGVFFIFSVPLGAFFSAKARQEFSWKIPPVGQFLTVFGGSVMMGVGAVIAGGCNLRHGITRVSNGAVSSIIAITAIVMGNWAMSYFKFIRPSNLIHQALSFESIE